MDEKKLSKPVVAFNSYLERLKPQIGMALPKHLNADRMARLALTAFSTSKALQECSMDSIAASVMTAAQLGLEPGVNGAGYLIPYRNTCTFVPGWKGLVDLVARSGRGTVYTGVIYEDQRYTFTDGSRRDLIIHNESELFDPEKITHTFAIGWVKGAEYPIIELWSVKKLLAHRDRYNKVGQRHYSYENWEMYARKIPLLQVLKYMPSSIELAAAIDLSNATDGGESAYIEDGIILSKTFDSDEKPAKKKAEEAEEKPVDKKVDQFEEIREKLRNAQNRDELDEIMSVVPKLSQPKVRAVYNEMTEALKE